MDDVQWRRNLNRLLPLAAGAIAIAAVEAGSAVVLGRAAAGRILLHDSEVTRQFLNSVLAADKSAERLFEARELQSFARHVQNLPGVVRANIYSPDGFIRYSTEENLVGLKFAGNAELAASLEGKLVAKLETISSEGKPEHLALKRSSGEQLIEAYLPLAGDDGRVVAVVEFYRKSSAVTDVIDGVTRLIWTAAAASGLLTLAALAMVLRWRGRDLSPAAS